MNEAEYFGQFSGEDDRPVGYVVISGGNATEIKDLIEKYQRDNPNWWKHMPEPRIIKDGMMTFEFIEFTHE